MTVSRVDLVVDTSAVVAILLGEPDAARFVEILAQPQTLGISAANRTEAEIVMSARRGPPGVTALRQLLERHRVQTLPVDEPLAVAAAEAFALFGKGHHKAGLNFGDCFAYAQARRSGTPLLFKGDDFSQTDVMPKR